MKQNLIAWITSATCAITFSTAAWAQTGAPPDPQMKAVLDELTSFGGKPIETLSPEEARKQPVPADAVKKLMKDQGKKGPELVADVDDIKMKLTDHSLDARVYQPKGDGPFPVILYVHGGGWVIGDIEAYDASPRALCNATGAVVFSVDYRLAPEYKFPAAHEDVFGAYQWLFDNAGRWKGDSKRIAVVGESAGGNLAAAVGLMAKDKGMQLPVHVVLIYPVTDLTDFDTPSYKENAQAKPLSKAMMEWFAKQTLAKPEDAKNPGLSIALAGDALKGLPPTTIINAQIDPLRSDGDKLAKALTDAGVKVDHRTYEGVTHEFFGMGAVVDKAKEAVDFAATNLKTAFSGPEFSE
ncbi:MAG: alpha/beta hydrolase [Chthoniobacteraceae bacterium]|nr:alpha/beta hydrolase [Chthoniobacteraceae bacterium]